MNRSSLSAAVRFALVWGLVLLATAAPTPGDIGGCGQKAQALDPRVFFATKDNIDCQRCHDCSLQTTSCRRACAGTTGDASRFPEGCYPLVHDGEVCLRALLNASCADYGSYISDPPESQSTPSECNFCPAR